MTERRQNYLSARSDSAPDGPCRPVAPNKPEGTAFPSAASAGEVHDQHAQTEASPFFREDMDGPSASPAAEQRSEPDQEPADAGTCAEAEDVDSRAELEAQKFTAQAALAAERLQEYQFWFPFIGEERPTADGRLSFEVPPGALHCGLETISLSSISGKSTPVRVTLTPGRARLTLEQKGFVVETDVPLTDFSNLPRQGFCVSTRYSTLRRLLAIEAGSRSGSLRDEKSATFTFEPPAAGASMGYLTYKFGGHNIQLQAEPVTAKPPLPTLEDLPLHRPAAAWTLSRALRLVSAFPTRTYYGPIVVSDALARGYSAHAVVEYEHRDLAGVGIDVDLLYVADLASVLRRSKLGLRHSVQENHTALSDGVIRYRVPKPTERVPQYGEMKREALAGPSIKLDCKELAREVRFINAATEVPGLPTTVRLVVEQEVDRRLLRFKVQRATSSGAYPAGVVESELGTGEHGYLPMLLLVRMTEAAEFDSMELRLTPRAGALIQKGDGSTHTCIFAFREAVGDEL